MKIKTILDTNVLISGVFWKGPPFGILKAWQGRRFRLAISLPILVEYRRVLDELTSAYASELDHGSAGASLAQRSSRRTAAFVRGVENTKTLAMLRDATSRRPELLFFGCF